jgi:CRISPR-associated protein Csm4
MTSLPLHRLDLRPLGPWRSPWQADTLSGSLCTALARREGGDVLRREWLDPAAEGRPPFVLSDAMPAGLLPLPVSWRMRLTALGKAAKRARWITQDAFGALQADQAPPSEALRTEEDCWSNSLCTRNCLDRASGSTGGKGAGGLFSHAEWHAREAYPLLRVYARVLPACAPRLQRLFEELARTGFGADASAGKGQFELASDLAPAPELDHADGARALVLSTFQPAPPDPADGAWECFIKEGRLGPNLGIDNVFKRPLVLFRPGACFKQIVEKGWLGRAIPMREFLADSTCSELEQRDLHLFHWAFGLCVTCPS